VSIRSQVETFPAEGDDPEVRVYGPTRMTFYDEEGIPYAALVWLAEADVDGRTCGQPVITGPGIERGFEGPVRRAARAALLGMIHEEREKMISPTRRYTSDEEIQSWCAHHPPAAPVVADAHNQVRAATAHYLHTLNDLLPEGPLKTTALTMGRQAMWAANACIAVDGNQDSVWQEAAQGVLYREADGTERPEDTKAEWYARQINKLGEFLAQHYAQTILHDTDAVDEAIRLLSVADSPAHRAAHGAAPAIPPWGPDAMRFPASGFTDEQLREELLRRSGADRVVLYADTPAGQDLAVGDGNDLNGGPVKMIFTNVGGVDDPGTPADES
jgi:hypothetical protein